MTTRLGYPLDYNFTELLNARLPNNSSDPGSLTSGQKGAAHYNTTSDLAKMWNGTTFDTISNILEAVSGVGAISVGAVSGKSQAISVAAASGSVPGTMSASDFTKLGAATNANTASTIVMRDGSGNFTAGTITAALTGTASNASNLNSQAASFYLDRANHTGTQLASTISNFAATAQGYRLDQFASATSPISGVDPTADAHLATKSYVDSLAIGLDVKKSARAGSTATVTVTYSSTGGTSARGQITAAPNTLDGVSLAANNRVLLKDQSTGAQDGIWVVTTLGSGANGVWDRATDWDADADVSAGAFVFIEEGTVNADSGWVLTTNNPIVVGGASGTALTFAQFSSAAALTAGDGLQKVGTVISAVGTANRITIQAAAGIDISASYVGQTSITTLGTVATGTWSATTIALNKGGTGQTTAAAALAALGGTAKFSATIGDNSSTTLTVTHNLGTRAVIPYLYDATTFEQIMANPINATTNTVTFGFVTAPATNSLVAVVVG